MLKQLLEWETNKQSHRFRNPVVFFKIGNRKVQIGQVWGVSDTNYFSKLAWRHRFESFKYFIKCGQRRITRLDSSG